MLTLEHLEAIRARVGLNLDFMSLNHDVNKALRDREALLEEVDRLTRALEDARPLLAGRQHLAARVQRLEKALCGTQSSEAEPLRGPSQVQSLEEALRDWAAQTMHPKG